MGAFSDFTVKRLNNIYGNTTIVHNKRIKMGLTCTEYVVADFVAYANSKNKLITNEYAYRRTGLEKEQFVKICVNLRAKKIIEIKKVEDEVNEMKITRLWLDQFMISEEWFEAFWLVNNKPFWPGSKADAKKKFVKLCQKYEPEYLIRQRDFYIKFLAHPSNSFRKLMGAPVFLNPETERFAEDWSGQLKRLEGPIPKAKRVEISKEEKDKLFR